MWKLPFDEFKQVWMEVKAFYLPTGRIAKALPSQASPPPLAERAFWHRYDVSSASCRSSGASGRASKAIHAFRKRQIP